jgi:hypothetical protein
VRQGEGDVVILLSEFVDDDRVRAPLPKRHSFAPGGAGSLDHEVQAGRQHPQHPQCGLREEPTVGVDEEEFAAALVGLTCGDPLGVECGSALAIERIDLHGVAAYPLARCSATR